MNRPSRHPRDGRRPQLAAPAKRGVVLVIVLVVIVVLAYSSYTFTDLMLANNEASIYSGKQAQARMLVDSGADTIRWLLLQEPAGVQQLGGLYNNPQLFQAVVVAASEDPADRGAFTLITPQLDELGGLGGVRYGLSDESTRVNLNAILQVDQLGETAARDLLLGIPNMTEEAADCILDWMDTDSEPREFGAEADYYQGLDPPYLPKDGPLDTVEELLRVKGIEPAMLFGADVNRNGLLDLRSTSGIGSNDDSFIRGWADYFTLYSREGNVNAEGVPRVFVNQEDLELLYEELVAVLPEEWATFIVAYRQRGPYTGDEEGELTTGTLDFTAAGRNQITNALDLVGAKVQVTFMGASEPTILASPLSRDDPALAESLPLFLDNVTVNEGKGISGRININQAPRELLYGIPGLDEELIDQIIEMRGDPAEQIERPELAHETWLLTLGLLVTEEGELDFERMKALSPFICAGGDVYRTQIVGYFQGGGAAARVEAVFDATSPSAAVLFWRDLSHLGRGYDLQTLGVNLNANPLAR